MVQRRVPNAKIAGSTPAARSGLLADLLGPPEPRQESGSNCRCNTMVVYYVANVDAVGSSPIACSREGDSCKARSLFAKQCGGNTLGFESSAFRCMIPDVS